MGLNSSLTGIGEFSFEKAYRDGFNNGYHLPLCYGIPPSKYTGREPLIESWYEGRKDGIETLKRRMRIYKGNKWYDGLPERLEEFRKKIEGEDRINP